MKLHYLPLLCVVLVVSALEGRAQPGPDPRINPLSTCNDDYLNREFVFIGRIRAVKEIPSGYVRPFWKTTVAIETSIKGQLSGEIELTLPKPLLPPIPESAVIGKRYIFTADQVTKEDVRGLFSRAWSTDVDTVSPDAFAKAIESIRAVLRGVPEPRIVGNVKEQSLETGFAYEDGLRLAGLVVVAWNNDGQKFNTRTDAKGRYQFDRYQFDKLPVGMYTVFPILGRQMELVSYSSVKEERYVAINDGLCGLQLDFIAKDLGRVVGRIEGMKAGQAKPSLVLYALDPKSSQMDPRNYRKAASEINLSETGVQFSFDQIPAGSYVLAIDGLEGAPTVYYPGVSHSDQAQAIKVVGNKITEIVVKLP